MCESQSQQRGSRDARIPLTFLGFTVCDVSTNHRGTPLAMDRADTALMGQALALGVFFHGSHGRDRPLGKLHGACGSRRPSRNASMKISIRQSAISMTVFSVVLLGLVAVDERVRERFRQLLSGNDSLSPWDDRLGDLGHALMSAVQHQSIENAPLLIFATVGAVLFLFMFKM
jgi:hypothetical protein